MTPRRSAFGAGGPLVYVLALVVVALTLGPVLYGALGGFRSNEQLARDPAGLPDPWVFSNYSDVADQRGVLALRAELHGHRAITTVVAVLAGVMAAYPLARYQFRVREPLFMVFVLGLLFPVGGGDHPAVHPGHPRPALSATPGGESRCRRRRSRCRSPS